jgi:phage baseplate assembly protein W
MPRENIYKGYSTFEFQTNKSLSLRDVELVKMDLLNHIFTPRGSRVMMPNFGTIIPELTFEPLDEDTLDELYNEVKAVLDYDPRVDIMSLVVVPNFDTNSVVVEARILYVELDTVDEFNLNIQFED